MLSDNPQIQGCLLGWPCSDWKLSLLYSAVADPDCISIWSPNQSPWKSYPEQTGWRGTNSNRGGLRSLSISKRWTHMISCKCHETVSSRALHSVSFRQVPGWKYNEDAYGSSWAKIAPKSIGFSECYWMSKGRNLCLPSANPMFCLNGQILLLWVGDMGESISR